MKRTWTRFSRYQFADWYMMWLPIIPAPTKPMHRIMVATRLQIYTIGAWWIVWLKYRGKNSNNHTQFLSSLVDSCVFSSFERLLQLSLTSVDAPSSSSPLWIYAAGKRNDKGSQFTVTVEMYSNSLSQRVNRQRDIHPVYDWRRHNWVFSVNVGAFSWKF